MHKRSTFLLIFHEKTVMVHPREPPSLGKKDPDISKAIFTLTILKAAICTD